MLEKTKPVNKKKVAVSIFFTAFAFGLNIVGISPVLGVINEKYQQYGTSVIQLLQTIQYLLIMVGSLIIGWLTTKISKKKIVLSGLLIIGICGIMPFFSENFWILVLSRILIGFGFGITGPMNTAIAAELIPEEERAGYMGLHVVGMGIGTMVGSMLGGMLAGWSYRNYYLVYLIPFIAMAGVQMLLVETPPIKTEKASDMKLNKIIYLISFASFVHTLFINAYSTNIGIYIAENISNNPGLAGMVTSVNAAFALVTGMCFSKISAKLKNFTLPFSILTAAVGYGMVLTVHGMVGVLILSALCGVSLSCFMAIGAYLLSISVEQEAVAKAGGVFSIFGGIGGLIAPIFMGNTAKFTLGENTANNQFVIAFFGMLIFGVIAAVVMMKKKENK